EGTLAVEFAQSNLANGGGGSVRSAPLPAPVLTASCPLSLMHNEHTSELHCADCHRARCHGRELMGDLELATTCGRPDLADYDMRLSAELRSQPTAHPNP